MTCTINGQQCTQCCRAITLPHSRRYLKKLADYSGQHDPIFILANWKPISKRRAKRKNPYLFKNDCNLRRATFFKCNRVTDTGCSVYEVRPRICRDYPIYGYTGDALADMAKRAPEYHPECTEWPKIPAKQI